MITNTKIFTLKLQITILFILTSFLLLSQHREDGSERFMASSGVVCSASDYQFQIGSVLYDAENTILLLFKKSGKGFVCEKDLPVVVTIYSKITGAQITATDVVWSGSIDGTYGAINQGLVTNSHFMNNDFVNFGATFTDNGQKVELKDFKLSKDIKVVALKSKNPSGFFDTVRDSSGNYIKEYWPSHSPAKEKPWLFVPASGTQNLELSVKSKAGKKPGNGAFKALTVNSNGGGMNITPNKFVGDDSGFTVGQTINTSTPYPYVSSCTDTVAYIYSQPIQSYGIDFFLLCETDDDVQAAIGPVLSPSTICIDPGPDGWIDEILRFGGPSYMSPLDTVITISGNRIIVAGNDLICQTTVNPNKPPECSKSKNLPQIINDLNQLYNPIGISFSQNSYDTLFFNYNTYAEDDSLSSKEQRFMYSILNGSTPPTNTIVLIVDNLSKIDNKVLGRATGVFPPLNHLSISKSADGFVLAHEIGHAKYGLRHPDNDPDHLIEGGSPPGPLNVNDKRNFMFSKAEDISNSMIRQYQWKKIHTGNYQN